MTYTTLLFNSVDAAREIAYMLRAEWDGCNAVTLTSFDAKDSAFKVALKVNKATFCHLKASQPLNPLLRFLYQRGIFLGIVFFLASLICSQLSSIAFRAFLLNKAYTILLLAIALSILKLLWKPKNKSSVKLLLLFTLFAVLYPFGAHFLFNPLLLAGHLHWLFYVYICIACGFFVVSQEGQLLNSKIRSLYQ